MCSPKFLPHPPFRHILQSQLHPTLHSYISTSGNEKTLETSRLCNLVHHFFQEKWMMYYTNTFAQEMRIIKSTTILLLLFATTTTFCLLLLLQSRHNNMEDWASAPEPIHCIVLPPPPVAIMLPSADQYRQHGNEPCLWWTWLSRQESNKMLHTSSRIPVPPSPLLEVCGAEPSQNALYTRPFFTLQPCSDVRQVSVVTEHTRIFSAGCCFELNILITQQGIVLNYSEQAAALT